MSEVLTRVCRRCGLEKALGKDLWVQNEESQGGFRQPCRSCFYVERRARQAALAADPDVLRKKYPNGVKKCAACAAEKELAAFNRSCGVLHSRCRECIALRWKAMTPEQRQAYYLKQRGVHQKANARYRQRYPDKLEASSKAWRIRNPEKIRENRIRQYYKAKARGGRVLVRKAMTVRINNSLKRLRGVGKKGASWPSVLGYSAEDLARHIERQFRRGMTWQNWGKVWELDHLVPISSFNIGEVGDADFMACWALANLRPLPTRENRKKSGKRLHLI